MTEYTQDLSAKTFKDLKQLCRPECQIAIGNPDDYRFLLGFVGDEPHGHMDECYILRLDMELGGKRGRSYYLIGMIEGEYRQTALIRDIDLFTRRVATYTGEIFSFDEVSQFEPDHLTSDILDTITGWGLVEATSKQCV